MPKKVKQGVVVSDKMEKTVVVKVAEYRAHRKYKKIIKTTKSYKARDEQSVCAIGDVVSIIESRPLAGTVRWVLSEVVTKAN